MDPYDTRGKSRGGDKCIFFCYRYNKALFNSECFIIGVIMKTLKYVQNVTIKNRHMTLMPLMLPTVTVFAVLGNSKCLKCH